MIIQNKTSVKMTKNKKIMKTMKTILNKKLARINIGGK